MLNKKNIDFLFNRQCLRIKNTKILLCYTFLLIKQNDYNYYIFYYFVNYINSYNVTRSKQQK